ncbi:TonB-dependent receptor domain-containing protein [Allopusillimonas ginsengisoli]|uniref:TonB-dependent receptor domain-containing protein n=1 Tax=Allopusillimonas ginsengisoli TaxID=453575 RepID=UPI0010212DCD|nr:TonB-dependent receptor [Allopusillimonas ginsengisoli]TEA78868.1 TonB-dependent receptor [Allopusillimonas ginsengisoli]
MEPKYWMALTQPSVKAASTGVNNGLAPAIFKKRHLAALISSAFISMAALADAHGQPSQSISSGAATGPLPGSVNQAPSSTTSSGGAVTTLGTISVAGQRSIDPADVPYTSAGSAAYISGEEIERFRGTSVGDFLSGIPGVMNADARNSGAVDINIRGMQGQGRVPVIVDGATQETTIWQGYGGATPRSYIDPDFISSVAIEKGISSAADATGATGGVVRASTIGVHDILLPGRSYGVRLKGGFTTNSSPVPPVGTTGGWKGPVWMYGENPELPPEDTRFYSEGMRRPSLLKPTGGSGSAVFAVTTDYVDFVAGYVRRKSGNFHAGARGDNGAHLVPMRDPRTGGLEARNAGFSAYRAGEEILNTSTNNTSWLLKSTLKPAFGHTLELGYRQYKSAYGTAFGTRLAATPYQNPLSDITLDTYTSRYKWQPENNNLIDLKIDAFQTVTDNRINTVDRGVQVDINELGQFIYTPVISPWVEWVGATRRGITASNTSRFTNPVGVFKLEYGGAFVHESVGLPDGVDTEWFREVYNTGYPREGSRKEISGFTALEYKPVDRVTLSASTRYSRYKTHDHFGQGSVSFTRRDSGWSASGGVMVEPIDGLKIYTKYGKATRAPSIFESLTGPSFYLPVDQNPIKLERARNLEIGVNYLSHEAFLPKDKLRLHAAYFDNRIDDYITRVGLRLEGEGLFGQRLVTEILGRTNLDYARMRGFEASARYDVGRYYGSLSWSHYMAVMFCARKGILLDGEPTCQAGGLPHSYSLHQVPPRNTVTLNLGMRLLERKLDIGARANYIGSRYAPGYGRAIGMSGVEPSRWSPYTQLDLYAGYQVSQRVLFDLAVDNVTDHYYMDALNAAQMPAPGRTIRGNVTIKF